MTSPDNQKNNASPDRVPLWIMGAIVIMIIGILFYGR